MTEYQMDQETYVDGLLIRTFPTGLICEVILQPVVVDEPMFEHWYGD